MEAMRRRGFLQAGGTVAAAGLGLGESMLWGQDLPGAQDVRILLPQDRVPLSFFIDDSTCLVNMGHFCMPQFAEAWPDRTIYRKPWKSWPREIPDAFVREFGEFCAEHGIKGKYSVVPCPACVGWLDRELPGWSRRELNDSLKLVRELMLPNWDIHPEMITHTRVLDLASGRPLAEISSATMENSYPQGKKSVDELAAYLAYALRILKNCDLPCEGITTPGGFGNGVETELSQAVGEAVRDVYGAELPHYFKYVSEGGESTAPKLEHVGDLDGPGPRAVVNVPAGTGDWFGGWDGDEAPQGHLYASDDAATGRMVELIERGQPAIMLCHWPGLYTQGTKAGFAAFRRVALALEARFGERTLWMKIGEIARYWAAKELTRIARAGSDIVLEAPFGTPRFTLRMRAQRPGAPIVEGPAGAQPLREASDRRGLVQGTWMQDGEDMLACLDLAKGRTVIRLQN